MGVDEVIFIKDEDVVVRVKEIMGGKGVWVVLDVVCGIMLVMLLVSVKDGGWVFFYGVLGGIVFILYVLDLFWGILFRGFVIISEVFSSV